MLPSTGKQESSCEVFSLKEKKAHGSFARFLKTKSLSPCRGDDYNSAVMSSVFISYPKVNWISGIHSSPEETDKPKQVCKVVIMIRKNSRCKLRTGCQKLDLTYIGSSFLEKLSN